MFHSGDFIIYGANGVCQITGICPSPLDPDSEKKYYVIKPLNASGNSTIFTPVDNNRVFMRKTLSLQQIDELINRMPHIETIQVQNDKHRKDAYKTAIQKCDPVEYIKIIKTVNEKRLELKNTKKHLLNSEVEFEQKAKLCLYSEFAFVLNIPFESVEEYIRSKINSTPQ
jgi:CarD family transcriptional regulator